ETHAAKERSVQQWLDARRSGNPDREAAARAEMAGWQEQTESVRAEARAALAAADAELKASDSDYVFITFVLDYLPKGLVGLLIAVIFCAALSSTASELNALGSTTTVDFR